jgi:hypothetical protein
MDKSHVDLSEQLASYRLQIDSVRNIEFQRDLRRMYESCFWTFRELDKESVTCRRIRKITPVYTDIKTALGEKYENLERYLMWATLM